MAAGDGTLVRATNNKILQTNEPTKIRIRLLLTLGRRLRIRKAGSIQGHFEIGQLFSSIIPLLPDSFCQFWNNLVAVETKPTTCLFPPWKERFVVGNIVRYAVCNVECLVQSVERPSVVTVRCIPRSLIGTDICTSRTILSQAESRASVPLTYPERRTTCIARGKPV